MSLRRTLLLRLRAALRQRAALTLAALALAAVGACAGNGAPAGAGGEPAAGIEADAAVSLGAVAQARLPVSKLAPEQLAALRCEELASYVFPGDTLPTEQRGPQAYQTLLEREEQQVWRTWLGPQAAGGRGSAEGPTPNTVLFLGVPTFEEFAQDGRWHGSGILLHCGTRAGWADDAPTALRPETAATRLPPLDPELPGDPIVRSQRIALLSYLDAPQRAVSAALHRLTVSADELLVDERAYYTSSGSVIRLALDTVFLEGGEIGFFADIRIQLVLPNTQERYEFLFQSEQDDLLHGRDVPLAPTPGEAVTERPIFAGLQTTLPLGQWQMRPSAGIKLGSPLDRFGRLRFDRPYRVGAWLLRPSETVFWFYSSGWGETTNFLADYLLRDDLLFRSDSTVRWTRELDYFEGSQFLSIVHTLNDISTLTYQTGVLGQSEPTVEAVEYLAAVAYRRLIHADYLYLELIPQTTYRKEGAWEPEHSFTLRFELFFRG